MSDSNGPSSFGFLNNWKIGLAVCVPCFAVGVGVTYYYYSKSLGMAPPLNEPAVVGVPPETNEIVVQNQIDNKTLIIEVEDLKKLGNAEFSKGQYEAAITYYTQAISICPEGEIAVLSVVFQNRAAAFNKLCNYENSLADCNKALALLPTYTKAISRRARVLSELGNYKLALEDITAVIMLNKFKDPNDMVFADIVIKKLGKQDLEEFTKHNTFNLPTKSFIDCYMRSFSDDPFSDEFSLELLKSDINTGLEYALKCIRDRKYDEIENVCQDELKKTDNSLIRRSLALNLLATFSILRGNYEAGIKYFTTVIKTPQIPNKLLINSLIKRGTVYHQRNQLEKCLEDYQAAEAVDANSSVIYHHRAQIFLLEMDTEKSIKDFLKAVELNPTFVLSNVQCSYAQYIHAKKVSNYSDIKKYLRQLDGLLEKYPKNTECYTLYAQALADRGEFEKANLLFKKVHELNPVNATYLVHRALVVLSWKNSLPAAVKILEEAIKVDPKCDYAFETLGTLYVQTGRLREAVDCLETAKNLCKSEKELLHIISMRNSSIAQLAVKARFSDIQLF